MLEHLGGGRSPLRVHLQHGQQKQGYTLCICVGETMFMVENIRQGMGSESCWRYVSQLAIPIQVL